MTPTKYIALVLRARRKEIGISQAEIGAMLNISRTTISMVEKGNARLLSIRYSIIWRHMV